MGGGNVRGRRARYAASIPNRLPAFRNVSKARSNCSRVWVAATMVRTRAWPFGTVGKPMPVARTPPSNSARESSWASRASPTITGVMGVSLWPVSKPAETRPCLK